MDVVTLAVAKAFTKQSLDGLGALKGANATIASTNKENGTTTIVFEWTGISGQKEQTSITIEDGIKGDPGVSIESVDIGKNNHIIITYSDQTTQDVGELPKEKLEISAEEGNAISRKEDGLYVAKGAVTLSETENNAIQSKEDGLYVPKTDLTEVEEAINTLNGTGEGSVDKKIADTVSSFTYLTKEVVTEEEINAMIANPTTANFNKIYLVKDNSSTGVDKYLEYQRLGNDESSEVICTGDTSTDLSNYVMKEEGKGLSSNDYDNNAVSKVAKIDEIESTVNDAVKKSGDTMTGDLSTIGELSSVVNPVTYTKIKGGDGVVSRGNASGEIKLSPGFSGLYGNYWKSSCDIHTEKDNSIDINADKVDALNSNLDTLEYSEVAGGKNIFCFGKTFVDETELLRSLETQRLIITENNGGNEITFRFNGGNYSLAFLVFNGIDGTKSYKASCKIKDNNSSYTPKIIISSDFSNENRLVVVVGGENGSTSVGSSYHFTLYDIQVEEGTTATEYEPYIPSVKMLASENAQQNTEAMDLKMLGWTVPRECPIQNYVDSDGVFHQIVGRVDLGTLNWVIELAPSKFGVNFSDVAINTKNLYCSKYSVGVPCTGLTPMTDKTVASHPTGHTIHICDTSYTDATTFKNAMQGVYLYYELAEEKTIKVDGNEAVTKINDSLAVIGKCKNLLNPTLQTATTNGVTCTNNGDGTYTLNGTASATTWLSIVEKTDNLFDTNTILKIVGNPVKDDFDNGISLYAESNYNFRFFSGETSKFNYSNLQCVMIKICSGYICNNLVFKPMITENLNATYDDFVPYTGDGDTLTADVAELKNDLDNYALKSLYGDTTINVGRLANSAVGNHSTAEGTNTTASGDFSHAEGQRTTANRDSSHAEGASTTASGLASHTEGFFTKASGDYSHAEGQSTTASGLYSHAEGFDVTASGDSSHAEGDGTTASGNSSHAEGQGTTASGESSHAEGKGTVASASYAHSEGVNTSAIGQGSHAEGSNLERDNNGNIKFEDPRRVEVYDRDTDDFIYITVTGSQAFGLNSHAEGCSTLAYGKNSHTEGYHTVADANESHAEGCGCAANAPFAHAEGQDTIASGSGAHAEGLGTIANGTYSHAEGFSSRASGTYSHAEGYYAKATNYASHASGKYNAAMTTGGGASNTTGTAFVIGNGTGSSALSNAFSVQYNGTVKAKSTITASTTADYAEFFEWLDKNPNEEDRVGHFVTLDGDKIKIATDEDDYILGIVSGEPFVLGNGDCDTWNGMYLHDEFRRTMYEPAPKMIEILDSEGNPTGEYKEVEGEYEGTRPILNPDYDPTQEYISRFDRAEWAPVGMLGVLAVLHDGTAEVNGYVTVNDEGIATKCTRDTRNSYRVIKKVSDKVVEVIFR